MQTERQRSPFITIGSSSLLVVFLVLCLVIFAVLALSSAHSDYTFSQKLAQKEQKYYEASNQGEEMLRLIDDAIFAGGGWKASEIQKLQAQAEAKDLNLSLTSLEEGGLRLEIFIDERQSLSITLALEEGSSSYEILAWQTVTHRSWETKDHIELLPAGE